MSVEVTFRACGHRIGVAEVDRLQKMVCPFCAANQPPDVQGEGFDQTALAAASMEVHKMLLREGSHWGTKACEEMGRTFMVAYRNALRDNSPRGNK